MNAEVFADERALRVAGSWACRVIRVGCPRVAGTEDLSRVATGLVRVGLEGDQDRVRDGG